MRVAAVDLGAGSARVAVVDLEREGPVEIEIVHRHAHQPVRGADGSLRWDWARLCAEVETGLSRALARGPLASIGIDTWGVDYGLLDHEGNLLSAPYCYRDARTEAWEQVADRLGRDALYQTTGVQLMAVNTVFQLAVHDRDELARASHVLLLPELLVHHLTGATVGEFTSAGTTALLDVHRLTWSVELLDAIGVPAALLPSLQPATTVVGTWRGVPVHLVGGHDTASAVAAMPGPPAPGAAFVSSGTWMLVGTEIDEPDVSAGAQAHNFSNELGVDGRVRFLKNVMGLWMLERCLASWDGGAGDLRGVLDAAANVPAGGPTVDATNERFLAPPDMDAEVRAAASLPSAAPRAVVARCVLDSLALATANVVDEIESVAGELVSEIHILGGGVRNELLVRLIGEATGRRLITGEAEATAVGNALVQGVAFGRFDDLADARRWLGVGRRGEV